MLLQDQSQPSPVVHRLVRYVPIAQHHLWPFHLHIILLHGHTGCNAPQQAQFCIVLCALSQGRQSPVSLWWERFALLAHEFLLLRTPIRVELALVSAALALVFAQLFAVGELTLEELP